MVFCLVQSFRRFHRPENFTIKPLSRALWVPHPCSVPASLVSCSARGPTIPPPGAGRPPQPTGAPGAKPALLPPSSRWEVPEADGRQQTQAGLSS